MGVRQEADYQNIMSYNIRGGCFVNNFSGFPVCFRFGNMASVATTRLGFRPVLYIR